MCFADIKTNKTGEQSNHHIKAVDLGVHWQMVAKFEAFVAIAVNVKKNHDVCVLCIAFAGGISEQIFEMLYN